MEFRAMSTFFFFLMLNLSCLVDFFGLRISFYKNYWTLAFMSSLLALVLFLFDKYQVHRKIMGKFEGVSQRQYLVFVMLTLAYMVFSIHFFRKLL
jgi:hypothetical protein